MFMNEWFSQWQTALQAEITAVKSRSNHGIRLQQGRIVFSQNGQTIAQYSIDHNNKLPEGVPITLHCTAHIRGTLLSVTNMNVILDLDGELEEIDERALMTLEPWRLLEKLGDTLVEAEEDTHKRQRIIRTIIPNQPDFHPADKTTSTLHELFLRSLYNHATYLWGPPGTGKTYTLARLAAALYLKGKKVLLLSHSNAAIDVLMLELAEFLEGKGKWTEEGIIRYGFAANPSLGKINGLLPEDQLIMNYPDLAEKIQKGTSRRKRLTGRLGKRGKSDDLGKLNQLEEKMALLKMKWNEKERELVAASNVIGTTLTKAMLDQTIHKLDVDVVIIDEASMAYVPQIAFAATLGQHTVVCGDFKQLPAVTTSFHPLVKKWMAQDVFHHAGIVSSVNSHKSHQHLVILNEQRRMHPAISSFTNQFIYDGYVRDHHSVLKEREAIAAYSPFPGDAIKMINTRGLGMSTLQESNGSRFHILSSLISITFMLQAAKSGAKSIGYITPYRAQAKWMEGMLAIFWEDENCSVESATIHRFQGSESDIILFDTVDHDCMPGRLFSGANHRGLVNVAVTRARGKFIHLQNEEVFSRHLTTSNAMVQLQNHSANLGAIASLNRLSHELGRKAHKQISWHTGPVPERLIKDLTLAKGSIKLYMPKNILLHPSIITSLRSVMKIPIKLYGLGSIAGLEGNVIEANLQKPCTFPLLIIDDQATWINLPYARSDTSNATIARVLSKQFKKRLIRQLEWT
ncbi:DEAD/DEAH box helicase [Jeotgalibacillus soli]|uniref:AAA+ ATPase domain-containing protein n=1 Tax=Jeotgalibacillus soli TaxID=889306 RepID=A0A0C2VLG6_9BACL|nr:AAA domain-containing protein [Jeotgalibacillus soli]KIL45306.1 hypothetical protein KP78_28500 [Jeotgalibacillus soli]